MERFTLFRMQPARPDRAVHGYVYYRWTHAYMRLARGVLDRPGLGPLREGAGRWLERTHHAKVIPIADARRIVQLDRPVEWRSLEHVVPFEVARDIVVEAPTRIALAPCACRQVAQDSGEYDGSCGSIDSCLYVGDPIASFVAERQAGARYIDADEALAVVERAAERGNVHTLWFKDAAAGRMYALCNCCSCCCIGLRAERAGFHPLATSGYVAHVTASRCTSCGICEQACAFSAIAADEGKPAVVDASACFGCGVCAAQCPERAIELVAAGPSDTQPIDWRAGDSPSDG